MRMLRLRRLGRAAQRLESAAAEMLRVATVVEATQQPMARRDPLRPRMDLIYREVGHLEAAIACRCPP